MGRPDSNRGHSAPKTDVLPSELRPKGLAPRLTEDVDEMLLTLPVDDGEAEIIIKMGFNEDLVTLERP